MDANEQRLIDLEIKISHQDVAIEQLQQTVFDQSMLIEKLEKTVTHLTERIDGAAQTQIGPGNEKPPHY